MFLRCTTRKKDGKEHTYYSVVENKRVADGRVVQRHVLYLGEINSSQQLAWRRSIEVLDEAQGHAPRTIALFPEDRYEAVVDEADVVRLRLAQLRQLRTYSLTSPYIPRHQYRRRSVSNVRSTPRCPASASSCPARSTSATMSAGTTSCS